MKIQVLKQKDLVLPEQATKGDAGYDIVAFDEPRIVGEYIDSPYDGSKLWKRIDFIEYSTNLRIAPKVLEPNVSEEYGKFFKYFHTLIFPRSSISKYYLSLANSIGLIDNGYRGEILLRFKYHFQPEDLITVSEHGGNRIYGILNNNKIYKKGDKIGQIVSSETISVNWEVVETLPSSERDTGGFGSSGK